MARFKKGDRVIYVSGDCGDRASNPLWRGKQGKVVGTITTINSGGTICTIAVDWDNGKDNTYEEKDLQHYNKGASMINTAKNTAIKVRDYIKTTKIREYTKPYEKYFGLIALALVIDHFILGGKFVGRFKTIAEGLVKKITDGLDKVIEKLQVDPEDPEVIAEPDMEE